MNEKLKIVILGGGYAGLLTAVTLQKKVHKKRADITLVNKHDYHYLTTKVHETAAGTLDPNLIRFPIVDLIDSERVSVVQDEVVKIDLAKKIISMKNGSLPYDYLVVSIGGSPRTFNIPGLVENAFFLFDLEGTERLREHIESQFNVYKDTQDEKNLNFVIGGAGFTGLEFLFEFLEHIQVLCKKYGVEKSRVRVICVDAAQSLLTDYDTRMSQDVYESIQHLPCEFHLGLEVSSCENEEVSFSDGSVIKTNTMIWTGGVKGNTVLNDIGFEQLDGRVIVNEF
ncbi:MAG: FAD-dependent oxidoreductase, partial [Bacillota bacterium]|nr:FAD-dependent oxidoreductase [Bacillota bacterium]